MSDEASREIEAAQRLVAGAREGLRHVQEALIQFDDSAPADEQVLRLAAAIEAVRAAREQVNAACNQLAEAAMDRGASPRLLDWSDGMPG